MTLSADQVADLLVAALAVNSYPLAQAWALLPALREHGLLDEHQSATVGPTRPGQRARKPARKAGHA